MFHLAAILFSPFLSSKTFDLSSVLSHLLGISLAGNHASGTASHSCSFCLWTQLNPLIHGTISITPEGRCHLCQVAAATVQFWGLFWVLFCVTKGPCLGDTHLRHTEGLLADVHVHCAAPVKEMRPVLSLAL